MINKSKVAFVEPLLVSAMILERKMDGWIKEHMGNKYGASQLKILTSISRYSKKSAKGQSGCYQSLIAKRWGVSEPAISRQIDILAKEKFLSRLKDPYEARKTVLVLTSKGKNFVSKVMRIVDKELAKTFRSLSKTSKQNLEFHLNKTVSTLIHITENQKMS